MKKSYLIYSMIAIASVMACNKMETNEQPVSAEEKGYDVIYATAEATKTALAGSGINEHIEWVKGDKVMVYNTGNTGKEYTAQSNGSTVAFAATGDALTGTFDSALYPSSCAVSRASGTKITAILPAEQDGIFHNIIFAGAPKKGESNQFIFTAVTSVIKINVPAEKNVIGIVLESDKAICGKFTATYSTSTKRWTTANSGTASDLGTSITIRAESGKTLSGPIYIAVLPNTSVSNITVKLFTSEKYGKKTNSVARLNVNTIENFGTANTPCNLGRNEFSVDKNGKKVIFSPGILQYQAKGDDNSSHWRFAQNQLTFIGDNPGNNTNPISLSDESNRAESAEWIDMFPYGHSCDEYPPYECLNAFKEGGKSRYFSVVNGNKNLTGQYAEYDWGANAIKNGDSVDEPKTWRLLTSDEFTYIMETRPNDRYCRVVIDNKIHGVMLFPDDFLWPINRPRPITSDFDSGYFPINHKYGSWDPNRGFYITKSEFEVLQSIGAVLIVNAGYRASGVDANININIDKSENMTAYWTSSAVSYEIASNLNTNGGLGAKALPVRLVRDVPAE